MREFDFPKMPFFDPGRSAGAWSAKLRSAKYIQMNIDFFLRTNKRYCSTWIYLHHISWHDSNWLRSGCWPKACAETCCTSLWVNTIRAFLKLSGRGIAAARWLGGDGSRWFFLVKVDVGQGEWDVGLLWLVCLLCEDRIRIADRWVSVERNLKINREKDMPNLLVLSSGGVQHL